MRVDNGTTVAISLVSDLTSSFSNPLRAATGQAKVHRGFLIVET
jgi:hypothetical protein